MRESLPGVEPVHIFNRRGNLVSPTGALWVAHKFAVCGYVQGHYLLLAVGAREIRPISTQQQCCVVALGEYIAQVIGQVVRVDGKHHHAAKAVALADRVGHLHRPLPRHPAQCGAADVEALFRLQGVGLEVGTVSDRCAQRRAVGRQRRIHDASTGVCHRDLQNTARRERRKGVGRCQLEGVLRVVFVQNGQTARQVFQPAHQCFHLGRKGARNVRGTQFGLCLRKGRLLLLLREQKPPVSATGNEYRGQCARHPPVHPELFHRVHPDCERMRAKKARLCQGFVASPAGLAHRAAEAAGRETADTVRSDETAE